MSLQSGVVTRPWRIRIKKAFNLLCMWTNHVLIITGLCRSRPEHRKKKSDEMTEGVINHMSPVGNRELMLVSAVVAGAEAGGAVGLAFIPPLLLKAGYTESQMSVLLGMCKCQYCFF